ncbi:MAG TPA: ABC transporter permease [Candidatus Acidoferrum sp.]|nr:ABC transporter permease [Candidatus Acidoferrum sp.]
MNGWLGRLFHKRRTEKRLDAELRFHLEQKVRDYLAAGFSSEEARRRANLAFGGLEQVKQDCRDARVENHVQDFLRDLQYAFRGLAKDRRFALVAIFALALGIGATTVMFSVLYAVVVDPFPYRDFQHSVVLEMWDLTGPRQAEARFHYTIPEFLAIRDQNHVFEDIVGDYQSDVLYRDGKGTRRFLGCYTTPNDFGSGVPPLLGRSFGPDDGKPGTPFVFMMNYKLWQTEFGGDPAVLGRTFFLNGKPRTLIGIMPQRFNGCGSSLWLPTDLSPGADGTVFPVKDPDVIWACARLKKGVSLETAAADVDGILHRMAQANPGELYPQHFKIVLRTLLDFVVGDFSKTLYALLAAVTMLLLIACGNVANLLLARATVREREIAVRASLGASRGRLIRQLLVEGLLLAGGACCAGCLLAYFGVKGLVAIIPRGPNADLFHGRIPEEAVISLKPGVLLFAVAIAGLTTLICGLAPALHAVRGNLELRMFGSGKGAGGGFRHGKLRSGLVIAEVALSIVLLTGSGLMVRSFFALTHVELDFNPAHMLYAWVSTTEHGPYETAVKKKLFYEQVLQRVKALPGVINATTSLSMPPLGGNGSEITVLGKPSSQHWSSGIDLCGKAYFQVLGLRLVRGRLLSETDIDSARQVAVVNEAFVRAYFGSANPLGQKIKFNDFDQLPETPHDAYFEIIGVIADFKNQGLLEPPRPEAFLPHSITGFGGRNILAATAVDAKSVLAAVQREIWTVDSTAAVTQSGSMEDFLAEFAYTKPQFGLITTSVFAGIGLALVLVGIFSVMAYTVALQAHELGIRLALGAQRRDVLAMVLSHGLRLISAGILIGVLASLGLTRFLASQLQGVSATDPLTFCGVALVFLAVGLAACFLPARRASQCDPLVALHYE